MVPRKLEPDSAAHVVLREVRSQWHGILVLIADERRHSLAVTRGAFVREVRHQPVTRQKAQFIRTHPVACIEYPLAGEHSAFQQRIGVGRKVVEICEIPITRDKIVDPALVGRDVQCRVRIVAPVRGARVDSIEPAPFRVEN